MKETSMANRSWIVSSVAVLFTSFAASCGLDMSEENQCAGEDDCVSGLVCQDSQCITQTQALLAIVGDWFLCNGPGGGCSVLDNDGTRFGSDGTWTALWSSSGDDSSATEPGEMYCEGQGGRMGTYSLSGNTLTLDGSDPFEGLAFEEDTFTATNNGTNERWERIDPPRSSGLCGTTDSGM